MRNAVGIGLAVMASLAGGGCAYGEVRHVLRAQFASDVDCAEVTVEKKGLAYLPDRSKSERFKVAGCGVERTYTCSRDAGLVSYDEPACPWVLGDPDQPKAAEMKPEGHDPFADEAPADTADPAAGAEPPAEAPAGPEK